MSNLEIFKLAKSKKYDLGGAIRPLDASSFGCVDWCEIRISTVFPTISNIQFSHRGCLLSRAIINALIGEIVGKTKLEAFQIIADFRKLITKPNFTSPNLSEKLSLFAKFSKFPSRRKCIFIGCNAIVEELNACKEE